MKRKLEFIGIAILLIVLAIVCADGAPPNTVRTNVTLTSDYPTNELSTNLWFNVYSSTNMLLALDKWTLIATVPGTNATFTIPLDGAIQRFYTAKASNSWWRIESDFSNVAWTEPIPRDLVNLRIGLDAF